MMREEEEGEGRRQEVIRQVGREIEGADGLTDEGRRREEWGNERGREREIIIYLIKTCVKIVIFAVILALINAH